MTQSPASRAFADYFRCPVDRARIGTLPVDDGVGFFSFADATAYGRISGVAPAADAGSPTPPVDHLVRGNAGLLELPFDLAEVVETLRLERYPVPPDPLPQRLMDGFRAVYYAVRPVMPVAVRRHLQRLRFSGWERRAFPAWPVDTTVERLQQGVMKRLLQADPSPLPFVWFWPEGAPAAAMMTHDVEGPAGEAGCARLMDLDAERGIPSSFQLVPGRDDTPPHGLIETIRARGFEVNLHDLSHDGSLFTDRHRFEALAQAINAFARKLECRGFRSGAMYRRQAWFDAFTFDFDMSVPNVAHLEPQRGGCCTVHPYFVGRLVELPLTTTQDYTLFHILGDYSLDLWRRQIAAIVGHAGLVSFIAHPDYLTGPRPTRVYLQLLDLLRSLREEQGIWLASPGDIEAWWRARQQLSVVRDDGGWRIEGPQHARARVAVATLVDGVLEWTVEGRRLRP